MRPSAHLLKKLPCLQSTGLFSRSNHCHESSIAVIANSTQDLGALWRAFTDIWVYRVSNLHHAPSRPCTAEINLILCTHQLAIGPAQATVYLWLFISRVLFCFRTNFGVIEGWITGILQTILGVCLFVRVLVVPIPNQPRMSTSRNLFPTEVGIIVFLTLTTLEYLEANVLARRRLADNGCKQYSQEEPQPSEILANA